MDIWSTRIQKVGTLYRTRSLRFSDLFREQYLKAFQIQDGLRMLEIGCGPGALCQACKRWYPNAKIIGTDIDHTFLDFARKKAPHIPFSLEDATALSFADESFDVTLSNTVAEHIPPEHLFSEQYRVLKPGGVCLVLSARRGIQIPAACIAERSNFEREIWGRVQTRCDEVNREYHVCAYTMNETEYPTCMEKYGFRHVSTAYLTVNLTPDNSEYPPETAHAMIEANRQVELDGIDLLVHIASDLVRSDEIVEMKRLANVRYDRRISLYDAGIRQWDTDVSVTMVLRGIR